VYLSVNGRTVRDRMLTSALLEACRHLLPPRRYPAAVLFLEVPAADVDVNVHPTKAEVRFRIPGLIYALLHRAVRSAFGLDGMAVPPLPGNSPSESLGSSPSPAALNLWPKAVPASIPRFAPDEKLFANADVPAAETESPSIRAAESAAPFTRSPANQPQPAASTAPILARHTPAAAPRSFRVLAQAGGMYIVLEDATGVKLIDQHALHERVLFETFLERAHGRARGDAQGLLIPETLDLSPAQTAAYHDSDNARELLTNLGFDVEAFGPRSLLVRAVPAILKTLQAATFVRDVLDAIAAPDESAPRNSPLRRGHFRERAAYMLSCKGAIKAGERLTVDQMTVLMDEFFARAGHGPLTCPHGRPLAIELSWDDLERGVGRK
jgi:DNA mismatch repair protein MutL